MAWGQGSLNDQDIANVLAYIHDNAQQLVYKAVPLLYYLEKNMPENRKSGSAIDVPVLYTALGNAQSYAAAGSVTATRRTGLLKEATFNWKHYSAGLTVAKPDWLKNQGDNRFNYLEFLGKTAMLDIKNQIQTDLWAASTSGDALNCINDFCDGATTLGGIAQNDPWLSTTVGSGSFSSRGISDVRNLTNTLLINGNEFPTCFFTSQTYYEAYEAEAYGLLHLTPTQVSEAADLGFQHLAFHGVPIFFDSFAAANHSTKWLALNGNHTWLYAHPDDEFDMEPWTPTYGQGTSSVQKTAVLTWSGQVVTDDPGGNGRLTDLSA